MANESYNAELVAAALKKATEGIDQTVTDFKTEKDRVTGQFTQSGTALGGHLGNVAMKTFEAENETAFNNLKTNATSFMQRAETISKRSNSAEQTTQSYYSER